MQAIRLRVDDLKNPIGISDTRPEFSWNCAGGKTQTAYQIVVRDTDGVVWDSGKVISSRMTHVAYAGKALSSRARLHWDVTLWDENGKEEPEESGLFEMGLLDASDWSAEWISGDYRPRKKERYPVDYFRKTFQTHGKLIGARLYATARGVYQAAVDGRKIDDFILAPGMTDYRKRLQVQTYDVTAYFSEGESHTLDFLLGDGWFRGCTAAYSVTNVYGDRTSLFAQLELRYADGKTETIATDETFSWSNDGPLRFADLKDGEQYDARRQPSYKGKAVRVAPPKNVTLLSSNNVPVREKERFSAKLLTAKDGTRVFDFGQNLAGYVSLTFRGKAGDKARLICGEVLDSDGHVDLSGIQEKKPAKGWTQTQLIKKLMDKPLSGETTVTPKQEIDLLCSGDVDHYQTTFSIFGFRYMELRTQGEVEVSADTVTAIAVYSDLEETGAFSCGNELVNRLVENVRWSMKGNFLDLPTDCPTRERLGWTGDAQIFYNSAAYLMNTAPFFRKWMIDMEDAQYKNGLLPAVLPYQGVEMMYKATGSSVGWADAVYLVPYRHFLRYGDKRALERSWTMIERYVDYLLKHLGMKDRKDAKANPDNAYTYEKGVHLGEWLEPEEFRDKRYGAGERHPEECTAYFYLTMKTVREIARILKKTDVVEKLKVYEEGAKRAYTELFIRTESYQTNRQAKLVRPLALGLLDGDNEKKAVEDAFVSAVENYRYRVGTGFLSTVFLLPVLTDVGRSDLAYKVLLNEERPGWLAEVKDGATTIWESWEGDLSRNHYSPGAVIEWLFADSAGIKIDGENHFVIAPVPDQSIGKVSASYLSPYGKVESAWESDENGFSFTITIPANTTAEIRLPDGTVETKEAGTHRFRVK